MNDSQFDEILKTLQEYKLLRDSEEQMEKSLDGMHAQNYPPDKWVREMCGHSEIYHNSLLTTMRRAALERIRSDMGYLRERLENFGIVVSGDNNQ